MYYKKTDYKLVGYRKARNPKKKYEGILKRKKDKHIVYVPFGSSDYTNYGDKTGLNLYKTNNDKQKRKLYRLRHVKDLKVGYYSPGYFSYYILW